jgi:hypothetical protein
MVEADLRVSERGALVLTLDGRKDQNKITRLNDFSREFN